MKEIQIILYPSNWQVNHTGENIKQIIQNTNKKNPQQINSF